MESLDSEKCKEKRLEKNSFLEDITSHRSDLYRYCRKLTSTPWDAEDLVQETLAAAYGKLADKHFGIQNLKAYLFKMATNRWIDWCRKSKVRFDSDIIPEEAYITGNYYEVKDTLSSMIHFLPPKERVAIVLSEAFESKNGEIAEILGTTEGAVKSAINRGREKLKKFTVSQFDHRARYSSEQEKIVDLAVDAFNRRDLEAFSKLFVSNAVGNAPGCFYETSLEEIKKGSLFHTINNFDGSPLPEGFRAKAIKLNGDILFAIFNDEVLDDVWKFSTEEGEIERFDSYYCCPEVLGEIAELLGKEFMQHGYYFEQGM